MKTSFLDILRPHIPAIREFEARGCLIAIKSLELNLCHEGQLGTVVVRVPEALSDAAAPFALGLQQAFDSKIDPIEGLFDDPNV